ncbi:MAG TPA: hypothetical protein VM285_06955 [Polyangia bacterium]|nr:hypothetical protein [Polyangia bacterium]
MSKYYELLPAYGRDYKTAKAAKHDFARGLDFYDTAGLELKPINIAQIKPGDTAVLRYRNQTQVTSVVVTAALQAGAGAAVAATARAYRGDR